MTTMDTRWANCYVKAVTLLPNILAKEEARRKGYDDAIFVTADGEVRECTSANLFLVHGSRMMIPRRTESILHGVTQGFILDCAATIGIDVQERIVHIDSLHNADEVFMSSTAVEILAVTSIDNQPVGAGCVGPVTRRLCKEFKARSRAHTDDNDRSEQSSFEYV